MTDILEDLKAVIAKHDKPEKDSGTLIRYVPICEYFRTSSHVRIFEELGGDTISIGKHGSAKVLKWIKVKITYDGDGIKTFSASFDV